ncbi:MAG: hypothetical protein KDI74_17195 [Gammaproteobacteria bacterium]|nr:hypothetical protein [Gammaproteobacteria bacterium]HXK56907.1 hypothetical protein [Gammaproteobacteria bacterium]
MSKNDIWYGYLQAGEKSTPVVRDMSLETNSKKTVYLYNHKRGAILEYAREIVEPKLVELNTEEIPLDPIKSAFKAARKVFLAGRTVKRWEKEIPDTGAPVSREADLMDEDISIDLSEEFEEDELEV